MNSEFIIIHGLPICMDFIGTNESQMFNNVQLITSILTGTHEIDQSTCTVIDNIHQTSKNENASNCS